MKKLNNAGLSLVELIVTVLIIGIISTGVTIAVVAMHRADADSEASKIATVLTKGRQQAISKQGENYVYLYADASDQFGIYSVNVKAGGAATKEGYKLDSKTVLTVAYEVVIDGTPVIQETVLTSVDALRIDFSKSSGAFRGDPPLYIKVTADKDLYVCLVKDTGRCYIDTTYSE